ncbi:MAG TPA: mycofactocin biosynthesis glycosyltransferase MftF [Streptosporangiaceae bacterium]|jgi:mycofactocin system glycosyltransferase
MSGKLRTGGGAGGPAGRAAGVPRAPADLPVPAGFRLRPDPSLQTLDDGGVLLGGSPYRVIRLAPAGARLVAGWWRGEPVPDAPGARALARRLLTVGMAHPDVAAPPADSARAPGPDDVTVVIPVRDRPVELARCLAGCQGLRVIVVDDGSADAAAVARAAAAAGARCLSLPTSRGPGGARNAGLAQVGTPFTAFVDSDCVPRPGWLPPLLAHFRDPAVAAVGPRIVAADSGPGRAAPGSRWLVAYEQARSALDMGPSPSVVRPGARVPYLPAATLVVRTAIAVGGFAADMPVGEDVDFVWRLTEAGWQVRYEPDAHVAHDHRVRLAAWFGRRRDYGTSAAPLELRHPGRVPAVSMSGWSALAWAATLSGRPVAGASVLAGTTALLARRLAPVTGEAWPVSLRLAGGGTLLAGRLLGSAVSRTWWPAALPVAIAVRRTRLSLAALVLAAPVLDWREQRPPMDPVSYTAARLLDDLAYSLGVWQGCLEHRTVRPLLPALWWRSDRSAPGGPA